MVSHQTKGNIVCPGHSASGCKIKKPFAETTNCTANGRLYCHRWSCTSTKNYKDNHGLHLRDVDHKDKQNFQAVINITSASHLLSTIPQANATKCYVELIKCVMDSYLDKDLAPLCRIEKLWYVAFS